MKYMILLYGNPAVEPAYGTPEFGKMMADFGDISAKMVTDGVLDSGEGLQGVETATTLRLRGGKFETMDGPFAETKEHLGGYYLMSVPDLDTAMKYAAMIPTAAWGTIELRPVMDY